MKEKKEKEEEELYDLFVVGIYIGTYTEKDILIAKRMYVDMDLPIMITISKYNTPFSVTTQ